MINLEAFFSKGDEIKVKRKDVREYCNDITGEE